MEDHTMRAYFFGNMYLSSIQQGIQAAHVVADMAVRYNPSNEHWEKQTELFYEWAENHKVMVLLNAGYSREIDTLSQFFGNNQNPYPYATFSESYDALAEATTCVGIILPDRIYNASRMIREGELDSDAILTSGQVHYIDMVDGEKVGVKYPVNEWEYKMIMRLNQYGLAR